MKKMVREDGVLRFINDEPDVPDSELVHLLQGLVATPDTQVDGSLLVRAFKALSILYFRQHGIMYDWKY